jgi:hypothetical protein
MTKSSFDIVKEGLVRLANTQSWVEISKERLCERGRDGGGSQ